MQIHAEAGQATEGDPYGAHRSVQTKPPYKDLYFGRSDSRNEFARNREEFVRSYVDLNNTSRSVIQSNKFLVLGPKGTGKSALGWYLDATRRHGSHFTLVRDASTLPLAEVPRLQTGQASGPERTLAAWKFILLCNYLELLFSDTECSIRQEEEAGRVAMLLRGFGFIGDAASRALVRASDALVTIPISQRGRIYRREGQVELSIYSLIPYLEAWAAQAHSDSRHVLVIDGLDSIFLNDKLYDESLSSLVQAAYQINQRLSENDASGSIVLLLRNDVFARIELSLPDSQKMRDDLSLDLDWRILSGKGGVRAPLVQLVDSKAASLIGDSSIRVLDYFPRSIRVGLRAQSPKMKPTLSYLLNLTRHTPRDLLRLFEEIRRVEESEIYESGKEVLTEEVIREGVLRYSTKYFVGAIRNEFAGVDGGPDLAATVITALKGVGKQRFDRQDFVSAFDDIHGGRAEDPDRLLRLLFMAGAIGNVVSRQTESYMQFYHRRDDAEIYLRGQFILHNALIHAWGMPHGA